MYSPSHSSWFYHLNNNGEQYRSLSSSLCSFLHSSVISSLLGPNILLRTLFSHTLSLRFFLSSQFQQANYTPVMNKRQNYTNTYFNLDISFNSKLEDQIFCIEWKQAFPDFSLQCGVCECLTVVLYPNELDVNSLIGWYLHVCFTLGHEGCKMRNNYNLQSRYTVMDERVQF